ncbi:DNA cytosine methyltransferase [Pedobacter panaciterrae]|uniref:DNA cytosine methyltransferase n=1 Tax=Pedobacter panaciterrae TaxID=363849 RepID=UPI0025980F2B|nr:DNA cytosine methyltransferase [uncultured Pedobacter sp.]
MLKQNKIPVLSFFSGGGFLDMGFISAGLDVVWTNEIDKSFVQLYKSGMTSWGNKIGNEAEFSISNTNSIKDISAKDIIDQAFNGVKPFHFGVIGGPPCQDFTINGNMDGFKGDRGSLTDAFLWKILELQPSFFVMENVTGLLRSKKTSQHFKDLLELMSNDFFIDFDVLNSLNFDVPQSRERVFVIGLRKNLIVSENTGLEFGKKWFPFPANKINYLKDVNWPLHNEYNSKVMVMPEGVPLKLCVNTCLVPKSLEGKIPNSAEYFNLYVKEDKLNIIKEGETNRPSFKRLHRFRYSPTTCYGNNEVHLHPYQNRRISVREALRIQGVSDSYVLPTEIPLSKKFKMIGNGVPVPLAKAVASQLMIFLQENLKLDDNLLETCGVIQ